MTMVAIVLVASVFVDFSVRIFEYHTCMSCVELPIGKSLQNDPSSVLRNFGVCYRKKDLF